jgi:hypothetical protein
MRLTSILFVMALSVQPAFSQALPTIHILYQSPNGSIFDRTCPRFSKNAINPDWIKEAVARRAEFQADWERDGPQYVKVALSEIGLPFPYQEMQATLTVCPDVGTMAEPLMLDVTPYLSGAPFQLPAKSFAFALYHELMHHYVRPVLGSSALIKKYATESPQTQNHLHVMALEKLALVKLNGDSSLMNYVNFSPTYKRAWQIVNEVEGYEPFVNELKAVPKTGVRPQ